jgi:thiol-disulfide isomerase/thioredoxin
MNDLPLPKTEGSRALGVWSALLSRRARWRDAGWCAMVCAFGLAAIGSGNRAAENFSPAGAQAASSLLDELQLPRTLPNASIEDEQGQIDPLWTQLDRPRTLVSFYAAWCGPCQRELPLLAEQTRSQGNLLVVIASDEDRTETRRQLDNLGLKNLHFSVDAEGRIYREARVLALPTTILVGRKGKVRDRVVGYSDFRLRMLLTKARTDVD